MGNVLDRIKAHARGNSPSTPGASSRSARRSAPAHRITTGTGTEVPAKYIRYRNAEGWMPTPVQAVRMFLMGEPGHGKTTFCMSNPSAWILDADGTCNDVTGGRARYWKCATLSDYIALIEDLVADGQAGRPPCAHVVFDTFDKFLELVLPYLTDQVNATLKTPIDSITDYGQRGKGWFKVRDLMVGWLTDLAAAGYGWTVTGHVQETIAVTGDVVTRTHKPVLPPSIIAALFRDAYYIGRISRHAVTSQRQTGTRTRTVQGKAVERPVYATTTTDQYLLQFSTVPGAADEWPTKARYLDRLPSEIMVEGPAGWDAFAAAYTAATRQEESPNV